MILRVCTLFIPVFFALNLARADVPAVAPAAITVDQNDLAALERFVGFLEKNKRSEAAELVAYPLRRTNPLAPLKDKREFLANYASFFDAKTIATLTELLKNKSEAWSSWRGTTLGGALWANGGKIIAINLATERQKKEADAALKLQKRNTHSSVDKYEEVEFSCDTPTHRVRIQRLPDRQYRYVSWRPEEKTSGVPELVLEKGVAEPQGTGGGMLYRFNDVKTIYEAVETTLCAENCGSYLEITAPKKPAVREACQR